MPSCSPVLCCQVPKASPAPPRTDVATMISDPQGGKRQQAYKTEIIGGVVVHTPIQVIRLLRGCGYYGDESQLRLCEKALSSLTLIKQRSMLLDLLPCGAVTYLKPAVLRAGPTTMTVVTTPFRMILKNQKGETGRATGLACWGAATVSNREMWWVHSWL